jgi:cell division transport system permease protein
MWLSIAAIAVMIVALTITLSGFIINVAARNAIKEVYKDLKVSVYLKDDASDTEIGKLQDALAKDGNTAAVQFVSKSDAKKEFVELNKGDEKLISGLAITGGDIFPAQLRVSVNDVAKMTETENIAKRSDFAKIVAEISLGKTNARNTITRAASLEKFVTVASIGSALVFAGVSMLIIFNTIRMAIFTRGEEIRIMKLIGATPNYIRGPFIVEAGFYGVIAGIVSWGVVYTAVYSFLKRLADPVLSPDNYSLFVETHKIFSSGYVVVASLIVTIMAGVLVGVVSSMLAMERYLKLKHW